MPAATPKTRLQRMFKPRHALFVGGSHLEPAIRIAREQGFRGELFALHPRHESIAGVPCVSDISELPLVPDLAFISVPKHVVLTTIEAARDFGVAGAVCNTAGFSELKDAGVARQQQLVDIAGDMPVLGPNCPGFANFLDRCVFMQDFFGDHSGVESGVAVISNGGAYLGDIGCARRSLPLAYMIGVGNEANLRTADLLDLVLEDPRVSAVHLYIEGLRDVPGLSRAAWRALQRDVPVVVTKGGRSKTGGRAAETHTASIAQEGAISSALFERLGFIEAASPMQATETLKMLTCTRRPAGKRTAFLTSSGSYGVLGGDKAEAAGLDVAPLSAEQVAAIQPHVPHFILPNNPLDISEGQFEAEEVLEQVFEALFDSNRYDLALLVMCFPPPEGWEPTSWYTMARTFARVAVREGLPCAFINTVAEDLPLDAREQMIAAGMAPLMGFEQGFRAVGDAVRGAQRITRLRESGPSSVLLPALRPSASAPATLDEAEAKARLAAAGVTVPRGQVVRGRDDDPLAELSFPVALKALALVDAPADPRLLHKSELGAVELGITSEQELRDAMTAMTARLREIDPALASERFLVEEMVPRPVAELLVGIRSIEGLGLALTLAFGGVGVELLQDTVHVILPAPRAVIERACARLKLFPLLTGYRGRPRADLDAALDSIEALADFALARLRRLEALEVNPLIVCELGQGAFVADAILMLRGER